MKLLIAGSDKVYAIENFYVKYLREMGVEVYHFAAQSFFYDYYQKNIFNKLLFRAGLSGILKKINDQFKNTVETFNPDIIWVFKGMELFPQSLQWAKDKKIKLVNYNPDSPFVFSGKGSGNANVANSICLYDLFLTYNSADAKKMKTFHQVASAILPFGFNITDDLYNKCVQQKEIYRACFLGNPDTNRAQFLQQLAEEGIQLDVYGNHWGKFLKHPNIRIYAPVYEDGFWQTLYRYRVQLNLMRLHNPDTHNMRSFEVPGVGGIQLAPATTDHKTYFEEGKEIFLYSDINNCRLQIKKILAMTTEDAAAIRLQARQRSLASHYTYKDRSAQALVHLNKLLE